MNHELEMNRRFLRSVNLGRDRSIKNGLAGYVITPSVRNALARIQTAFVESITERAFTLTGPYGTGKSSFGLFLWHLLSDKNDAAWTMLAKADKSLADSFMGAVWGRKAGKGCLALTLTARCAPVAELLADAFDGVDLKWPEEMSRAIDELRASRDTKCSMRLLRFCVDHIAKMGYTGVFFIFDEFGKIFEEARRESGRVDVFLLQELAEAASRSTKVRVFFMGMLHQSIADYAATETILRNEFSKIEGRFEPIAFIEPVAAQIHLAASAFPDCNPFSKSPIGAKLIKGPIEEVKLASLVGLKSTEFASYATRALPLHPITLAALPLLFRRFGQNERSIFSFLTSNEAKGLREFFKHAPDGDLFRLCDLFDYFFENYEAQLVRRSFGHPFVEAHAAIQAKASLSPIEVETLKTVAVLTSLGLQSPIHASEEMVAAAMAPKDLGAALSTLRAQSVLVYRKFNKTFALWNGSDINLDECCENANAELRGEHFSVAETFRKFVPPTPIVAKRHTVLKGSMRYFDTVYVDDPDQISKLKRPDKSSACGTLVVCLTDLPKWRNWFETEAIAATKKDRSLVVAIPGEISDLTDALLEIRRLNWVAMNVKELRDDRIASREVAIRLAVATQAVRQHQSGILDPRPARLGGGGCKYVWNGEVIALRTMRDVSVQFSVICDVLYPDAPVVRNELVNKRVLSSQAAAARRILINLLNSPDSVALPRLGIEGYPPERSIYESVVAMSGMHRCVNGRYVLSSPSGRSPSHLLPAWQTLERLVFDCKEPISLRALYDELAKPPLGVLEGLAPILVAVFYAVNKNEVSFYAEGTFVPEPQEAHFELLLRRPELFALSGMRISGVRKDIVERLSGGLQTEPRVLPVVRRLYTMMNSLSKYARETNAVSEQAQTFRQAFFDARSPEKLLFTSIPVSLGMEPIGEKSAKALVYNEFFKRLNNCMHELAAALPKLIEESRRQLLEACGYEPTPEGWKSLYDKSSFLIARIGGSDICPFLQNVVNTAGDWQKADVVVSYIQQMPISKWGASQIAEFKKNVLGVGERFMAAARPYAYVSTSLSKAEQKAADSVKTSIVAISKKHGKAVMRAALLACLEELEGK